VRNDMTNWLIHFVHKKNVSELPDNLPEAIENAVYHFSTDIVDQDEFASIFSIISECGIRYGYSFRNMRTTVYGGEPVICFSEMPFSSYMEYVKHRNNIGAVGRYAIAITKADAFNLGARPVIYGLSPDNAFALSEDTSYRRILDEKVLPLSEQYRFVSFLLGEDQKADWTHEREWRMKPRKIPGEYIVCEDISLDLLDIPALDVFNLDTVSGPIVLIVNTVQEAEHIQEKVQMLSDAGSNNFDIPFTNGNIRILITDRYLSKFGNVTRIEDLPEECFYLVLKEKLDEKFILSLSAVIDDCKSRVARDISTNYIGAVNAVVDKNNCVECGRYCGYANVVSYSPNDKIVRALVKLGLAHTYGDYYVVDAIGNMIPYSQSMDYNEHIAMKMAEHLNLTLKTDIFSYISRAD